MAGNESGDSLCSNPIIVALAVGGLTTGGAGIGWLVQPGLQQDAVQACYNNSKIAIDIAAQHGGEIQGLRTQLYERTQYRYTTEDAEKDRRRYDRVDQLQNERLQRLEALHRD